MENTEIIEKQRNCFKQFMQKNGLNAFSWAKKAGIAEATIRHYLSGRNKSLTSVNLEKLARSVGVRPEILMNCSLNDDLNIDGYSFGSSKEIEIDRELFIYVFVQVEKYLQEKNLILPSSEVKANVIIAFYQLIKLLNIEKNVSEYMNLLDDLIKKISISA